MTKNYNRDEFVEYVKSLKFHELEDAANFIDEYYRYFESIPEEEKDAKQLAWEKYVILLSKYGHWFVSFSLVVMDLRKKMVEDLENGQNT